MGILTKLIEVILNLVVIGIDVTVFFILIRIVLRRWTIRWLVPFDTAGKKLVDSYGEAIAKLYRKLNPTLLTSENRLVVGLIILMIVRFLLIFMAGVM